MRFDPDEINLQGLEQLTRALKVKNPPHIEIGIIEPTSRENGKADNASIGAAHEYGAPEHNLPSRSWLRMPLTDHLQDEMETDGLLSEETTKKVISDGSVLPWLEKVKKSALAVVKKAFTSNGFGKWKELTPRYAKRKKVNQILVETGQLRDSVDAKVVS